MREELKPCAHCGGRADYGEQDEGWQFIECSYCGMSTRLMLPLKDEVYSALDGLWNRRAPLPWRHIEKEQPGEGEECWVLEDDRIYKGKAGVAFPKQFGEYWTIRGTRVTWWLPESAIQLPEAGEEEG